MLDVHKSLEYTIPYVCTINNPYLPSFLDFLYQRVNVPVEVKFNSFEFRN